METKAAASLYSPIGSPNDDHPGSIVPILVPFRASHLSKFTHCTEGDSQMQAALESFKMHENAPYAHTVLVDGEVLACGGIVPYWEGRGEAWAIVSTLSRDKFVILHRIVQNYLDKSPFHRIEAVIFKGFAAGHRWVRLLGFQCEAETLRKYGSNGQDYTLYARIK